MPTSNLPRYSIGLTLTAAQVDRLAEMINEYNSSRAARTDVPLVRTPEEMCMVALWQLDVQLLDAAGIAFESVFEAKP